MLDELEVEFCLADAAAREPILMHINADAAAIVGD